MAEDDQEVRMTLRFPVRLRDRVKAFAERNNRSLNGQIVESLTQQFPDPWPLEARIDEMVRLLAALRESSDDEAMDKLTLEMRETLKEMASGRVTGISARTQELARKKLDKVYDLASDLEI